MAASPVDRASRTDDAQPSAHRLRSPIFIIGCGRSGTTIVYDLLCEHPDLAWFSNYAQRWPAVPQLAALSRARRVRASASLRLTLGPLSAGGTSHLGSMRPGCEAARNRPLTEADANAREKECVRHLVNEHARYQGKAPLHQQEHPQQPPYPLPQRDLPRRALRPRTSRPTRSRRLTARRLVVGGLATLVVRKPDRKGAVR